jgi:hypothetical protein
MGDEPNLTGEWNEMILLFTVHLVNSVLALLGALI